MSLLTYTIRLSALFGLDIDVVVLRVLLGRTKDPEERLYNSTKNEHSETYFRMELLLGVAGVICLKHDQIASNRAGKNAGDSR